ncbi:(2Fe-2S)-binding protein [Streptomyces antimycoticus]|uniref:(2Fe-2S)-binding protein n=2 Tax=Streptomyces violaceusniger group TaxID=2839105 RepID=A0ABD5J0M4_9ACTN|nr:MULTISPECIES: (2Fe-2S)-binding protein [Streptomyces]KUL50542.1 ferric iron reductase [Streptomyces violaceusniger]MEE4581761.1 (2Fe-2S)-binding protein [Streptomyces sp. DSM 41602]WJD95510.1 (2Fe-2S)-binding protein [Streptomyces antimycoticus]WTB03735.1 (2Fe-2S)-binding protein [Streptomyces antimycoticus]
MNEAPLPDAARVGPFFALRTGSGDPREEGYVRIGEAYRLTAEGAAGPVLRARVEAVAASLRTDEPRVAASLAFQGLAARVWSLALGPAALSGRVPHLRPDRLWWNPGRVAPDDLWWPGAPHVMGEPGGLAGQVGTAAFVHLMPLHHAIGRAYRVSERLLWGNAASALAGSLRVLHDWCRAHGRAEAADRATELARAQLVHPPLREAGTLGTAPLGYRRRTCCLYYRVPGGGLCGDCVLREAPGRGSAQGTPG